MVSRQTPFTRRHTVANLTGAINAARVFTAPRADHGRRIIRHCARCLVVGKSFVGRVSDDPHPRTPSWRPATSLHLTVPRGGRLRIAKPPGSLVPRRRLVSGWRCDRSHGRPHTAPNGGSTYENSRKSQCTRQIGHQLLTDWTETTEIDSRIERRNSIFFVARMTRLQLVISGSRLQC